MTPSIQPMSPDALSIPEAQSPVNQQPDSHTRRYDRQLRLWAASGQSALESARVLVLSGGATSAQVLKNLVLPGVGSFTILDSANVSGQDAGNNFFLHRDSVGKSRAEEAVKFLAELNDSVTGKADTRELGEVLEKDPASLRDYTLVIAHNLPQAQLKKLSKTLWGLDGGVTSPPLIIVRSAGFLAEISIQLYEHTIVDAHTDELPSYRLDKAFPGLEKHAVELDFDKLDVTDHGHVPYFVILVRALHDWKEKHGGNVPTYKELREFKDQILAMKKKLDEENFDEAVEQAYKIRQVTGVPSSVKALFSHPSCVNLSPSSPPFFVMLHALSIFTQQPPHTLPLSPTLPDLKSDTKSYIHLQTLYKTQAQAEKAKYIEILEDVRKKAGVEKPIPPVLVDEFVKNSHQLTIIKGKPFGEEDDASLATAIMTIPSQVATHLAFNALFDYQEANGRWPTPGSTADEAALKKIIDTRLEKAGHVDEEVVPSTINEAATGPTDITFRQHLDNAVGEIIRAPTSELPTTAALLGGLVAQEAIKLITRQYVPIDGVCVIDLISSTTGTIKL